MKEQPIEAVIWRTLKILRVSDYDRLLSNINITHPCTGVKLSRYLNQLIKKRFLYHTAKGKPLSKGSFIISESAPAEAPIFRKHIK